MQSSLLDLQAPVLDIRFDKGSTLAVSIFCYDELGGSVDFSGCSAALQARLSASSASVLTGFDLTTSNGGLSLTSANDPTTRMITGCVNLSVPKTVTEAITWTSAVYDLEVTDTLGRVFKVCRGTFTPENEVTR